MRLLRSTATIGAMTLLSRVLGLARDILWAKFLGASAVNDALLTATKLPNLFRRMFAEGAFNSAFIPLYARKLEGEGEETAANFAGEALAALTMLVALIVIAFQLTMPWTLNLIGGGLDKVAGPDGLVPYDLAVLYARITMPYLLLMSLAALFSGLLNTRSHFALAAFVPTLLNIVWITLLLWPGMAELPQQTLALYLAVFMTFSGLLQAGFLVAGLRRAKIRLPLKWPRITPGVRRLAVLGLPGLIAAGITHINLMVSHWMATFQTGAASWLYYADRLYQLPLGMIGIAMGVALLPALSRALRAGDESGAMETLNRAAEISALLTLPAAAALFVIPELLISVLFERGRFLSSDSLEAAKALRMFALGLPAFVLLKVLTPTFFAREDTRTPMVFASLSAGINLVLGASLFFTVGFFGLALATSAAAWVNVICLAYVQRRDAHFILDARLLGRLPRIIIAAALMGAALAWLAPHAAALKAGNILWDFALVGGLCGAGLIFYVLLAWGLGALSPSEIRRALKKG
jgi:putative peptidoglycan lipid II flippase